LFTPQIFNLTKVNFALSLDDRMRWQSSNGRRLLNFNLQLHFPVYSLGVNQSDPDLSLSCNNNNTDPVLAVTYDPSYPCLYFYKIWLLELFQSTLQDEDEVSVSCVNLLLYKCIFLSQEQLAVGYKCLPQFVYFIHLFPIF